MEIPKLEFISTKGTEIKTELLSKKCQCCLSKNNLKSMIKTYIFNGKAEVYSEMLSSCFAIQVIHNVTNGDSYQICSRCICCLREGWEFKSRAVAAQKAIQDNLSDPQKLIKEDCFNVKFDNEVVENLLNTENDTNDTLNQYEKLKAKDKMMLPKNNTLDLSIQGNDSKTSKKNMGKTVKVVKRKIVMKKAETINNEAENNLLKPKMEVLLVHDDYNNIEDRLQCAETLECTICNRDIKEYKFTRHMRVHSWNELQHKCPYCPDKKFASFHSLVKHSVKAHETQNFECEYCCGVFIVAKEFLRHVRACYITNVGKNLSECDEDSEPLSRLKVPKLEQSEMSDISNNTVFVKEEIFINNIDAYDLDDHYDNTSFSRDGIDEDIESNCRKKPKKLTKNTSWKKPPQIKKTRPVSTRPRVNWKNMSREEYKRRRVMLNQVRLLKEVPVHLDETVKVCHVCGEEFSTHTYLRKHLSIHFPNYICYHCGRPFARRSGLKSHLLSHDDTTVSCEICNKVIKKSSMYRHIGIHTGNNDIYKCPSCSLTFKAWTNRMDHMKQVHNIQGNVYKCKICFQEFRSSSILNMHIRKIHLNERRFSCTECDKSFFAKAQLEDHFRHHSGERFRCTICSKCYIRKSKLMQHMRQHTTEQQSVGVFA